MAYATRDEVKAEFKKIDIGTTGTSIIESEVDRFLEEADAEINAYISNRYLTPVTTGTDSLLLLRKIEIDLVVFRITKILSIKKALPVPDEKIIQEITEGTAYREAINKLKMLQKGMIKLIGADGITGGMGFGSYNTANNIEPVIKKYETQW